VTTLEVVRTTLVVEIAILVTGVVIVIVHALGLRAAQAANLRLLERGRSVIYAGLQRYAFSPEDRAELIALPRDILIRLLTELAPSLVPAERDWMGRLADESGLTTEAERRCRSWRWARRLNGARLLTLFGRGDATMLRLTRDENSLVRSQAAEFVGLRPSPEGIDAVVSLLDDPDPLCRFVARDTLTRLGRVAHPTLLEHLSAPAPDALDALLAVAAAVPTHEFAPVAMRHLHDERPIIRVRSAEVLRSVGGADAAAALVAALRDPDAGVRAAALDGLATLGYWPAAPTIASLMNDPAWAVRLAAGIALQRLGAPGELLLRHTAAGATPGAAVARRVLDSTAPSRIETAS
jgi:hypothetical protein